MDRATIRASLLLLGFESRRYKYQLMVVRPAEDYGYIRVLIYPYWIIGVHTPFEIKNFISADKAWRYITQLLDRGH